MGLVQCSSAQRSPAGLVLPGAANPRGWDFVVTPTNPRRIAKVGRGLWRQDACSRAVSISPPGDTVASLGNPGHCLTTFTARKQSKTKQKQPFFLVFKLNFLCFRRCPLCPVPSLDTAEESLAPPSLLLPTRYLCTGVRSPEPSLAQICSFLCFTSSSFSHLISLSPNVPPNINLGKQLLPLAVTMGAFVSPASRSDAPGSSWRTWEAEEPSWVTKGFLKAPPSFLLCECTWGMR